MAKPEKKFEERLNIQLDTDMYRSLNDLAILTGLSVADLIRRCVDAGLGLVKREAMNDPKVLARIKEQQKRLNVMGQDLLALHQNKPPAEDKVEAKLREVRARTPDPEKEE
jgi:hypothetical protein